MAYCISFILGTRPEIIKMAPVIKYCQRKKIPFFIIHTNQHYSQNMDKVFFDELRLPQPDYNLEVGSGTDGIQLGRMLEKIEKILLKEKPDIVLVEGDTNTVLAGALAAVKLHIKIGHIEAGLRSYDKTMPEEINRILTDHASDFLFAPTESAKHNLLKEGINEKEIFVTGNTIVDAIRQNMQIAKKTQNAEVFRGIGIEPKRYFLLTLHRRENVDGKERFKEIITGLVNTQKKTGYPIIFPIHPRTLKNIKKFDLMHLARNIKIIEPMGYLEFLYLQLNAKLILTDSGGVQEEGCILGVPCVTLRENTERPETLEVGSNILGGYKKKDILKCTEKMLNKNNRWENPFGNGRSAKKIMEIIRQS